MPPLPRRSFHRLLRGLSPAAFASFVADLWSALGWETTLEEGVLVATRGDPRPERRVLLCLHAAPWRSRFRSRSVPSRTEVTDVVTSGTGARAGTIAERCDARVVDREDLYDRSMYALDGDAREALFETHFGRSATRVDPGSPNPDVVRGIAATVAILALIVAVVSVGVPIDGSPPLRSTPTAEPTPVVLAGTPSTPSLRPASPPARTTTARTVPTPTPTPARVLPDVGFGDGAWAMFGGGPARTGWNPRTDGPHGPIAVLATFEAPGEQSRVVSSPAVVDGTVYVGTTAGRLFALDAGTLAPRWGRSLDATVTSSPAVGDGTVYVGTTRPPEERSLTPGMHALALRSGTHRWRSLPSRISFSSPAVADGTVYVGNVNGYLYALNGTTGRLGWTFETGALIGSSPAVSDDAVYVGSSDDAVYAIDRTDGTLRWTYRTNESVVSSPAVVDRAVYVGSNDGHLYALDAASGAFRWRHRTNESVVSSPAVAEGSVYVGSNDGYLYALDAASGEARWIYRTNGSVVSSPAVADDTVYLGSTDGRVHAIDARTGEVRWTFRTGAGVVSSPAVADDVVYVGTDDGTLYALGTPLLADGTPTRRRFNPDPFVPTPRNTTR